MHRGRVATSSHGFTRQVGSVGDSPSHGDGRSRSRRRRGLAGALAVVGLAVAGCTSDPGPTPTPSVTQEASPSPTPTPTPTPISTPDASVKPERPAAMDAANSAGAEAVAVYFLQLVPYVNAIGDPTEFQALSHPECIFCGSVIDGVQQRAAASQHTVGGIPTITAVGSIEVDPGRWWSVDVDLVQAPSQTVDINGAVVGNTPETISFHMDIAVVYEDAHWVVRGLSYTETGREAG